MSQAKPVEVTLIVRGAPAASTTRPADAGGDEHGLVTAVRGMFKPDRKPVADMKGQLQRALGEVDAMLEGLLDHKVAGMAIEGVDVGLAVTAEGSIGVATVGLETSITLRFARPKAPGGAAA
jgi:hypothetical protein